MGISAVAQNVHFGAESFAESFKDNVTITPHEFYRMLASLSFDSRSLRACIPCSRVSSGFIASPHLLGLRKTRCSRRIDSALATAGFGVYGPIIPLKGQYHSYFTNNGQFSHRYLICR